MLQLITALTFAQAVDSLYKEFHAIAEGKREKYVALGLPKETASRVAFVDLLFSADSGALGIVYRNNSAQGTYRSPLKVLKEIGYRKTALDCDEIAPVGVAALRALGVEAKVGFYHNHAVVVVERPGPEVVVDLSFPSASPYSVRDGAFSYQGYFYDSLSFQWMVQLDKNYATRFAQKVAEMPKRLMEVRISKETFEKWREVLKKLSREKDRKAGHKPLKILPQKHGKGKKEGG